jgi:multimeric flavodoxin WrbA
MDGEGMAVVNLSYCRACCACRGTGVCAIKDDMAEVLQKMIDCDVMVFASPVYFYSICAQLKTVLDRTVARWTEIANKDLYYIATAAEEDEDTLDITLSCFHGFAMCINGYEEKGTLYGKGVYEKGDVKNRPELMTIAYEMGLSVHD